MDSFNEDHLYGAMDLLKERRTRVESRLCAHPASGKATAEILLHPPLAATMLRDSWSALD